MAVEQSEENNLEGHPLMKKKSCIYHAVWPSKQTKMIFSALLAVVNVLCNLRLVTEVSLEDSKEDMKRLNTRTSYMTGSNILLHRDDIISCVKHDLFSTSITSSPQRQQYQGEFRMVIKFEQKSEETQEITRNAFTCWKMSSKNSNGCSVDKPMNKYENIYIKREDCKMSGSFSFLF